MRFLIKNNLKKSIWTNVLLELWAREWLDNVPYEREYERVICNDMYNNFHGGDSYYFYVLVSFIYLYISVSHYSIAILIQIFHIKSANIVTHMVYFEIEQK